MIRISVLRSFLFLFMLLACPFMLFHASLEGYASQNPPGMIRLPFSPWGTKGVFVSWPTERLYVYSSEGDGTGRRIEVFSLSGNSLGSVSIPENIHDVRAMALVENPEGGSPTLIFRHKPARSDYGTNASSFSALRLFESVDPQKGTISISAEFLYKDESPFYNNQFRIALMKMDPQGKEYLPHLSGRDCVDTRSHAFSTGPQSLSSTLVSEEDSSDGQMRVVVWENLAQGSLSLRPVSVFDIKQILWSVPKKFDRGSILGFVGPQSQFVLVHLHDANAADEGFLLLSLDPKQSHRLLTTFEKEKVLWKMENSIWNSEYLKIGAFNIPKVPSALWELISFEYVIHRTVDRTAGDDPSLVVEDLLEKARLSEDVRFPGHPLEIALGPSTTGLSSDFIENSFLCEMDLLAQADQSQSQSTSTFFLLFPVIQGLSARLLFLKET